MAVKDAPKRAIFKLRLVQLSSGEFEMHYDGQATYRELNFRVTVADFCYITHVTLELVSAVEEER